MDPLTVPLTLGCILSLSHVNRAMTGSEWPHP